MSTLPILFAIGGTVQDSINAKLTNRPVSEEVRKKTQAFCDRNECGTCLLNGRFFQTIISCDYFKGCMTGQCPVCIENEKQGRDTYSWLKNRK